MIHTTHAMEYYAAIKKQWGRFLYASMVWSPKYIKWQEQDAGVCRVCYICIFKKGKYMYIC